MELSFFYFGHLIIQLTVHFTLDEATAFRYRLGIVIKPERCGRSGLQRPSAVNSAVVICRQSGILSPKKTSS